MSRLGISVLDCEHRTPKRQVQGMPYVTIPEMKDGRIDLDRARKISHEDFEDWTRKALPQDFDVVLSRRTNPGETALVRRGQTFALGQNLVLLRSSGEHVFPPFLYWITKSPEWRREVSKFLNVGAVFDSLKIADIRHFCVPVPPVAEQANIAYLLGAIDDKIELNRRMSETLEEMVHAVFKEWFLGGSCEDQRDEEWALGSLGDIAVEERRGVDPAEIDPATPYIGLEHMPRKRVSLDDWGRAEGLGSNKLAFREGDILFGKLRPYFHKVGFAPVAGICSTDIVVIVPKAKEWFSFVLGLVSSDEFVQYTDGASTGTRMPRTNWKTMAGYELRVPSLAVAGSFDALVRPMANRMRSAVLESRVLANLRDALLPKLISGEIRVPDAEHIVSEVA